VGTVARTLELDENTNGTLRIESQHNGQPLTLASGRLTGLVEAVNNGIPAARDELSLLADQIVRSFDQQHAVGLTDPAGYSSMRGLRKVKDPSFPLSQTGLAFPIAAGDLSVSVTDKATGLRTTERISIDPAVDSLDDITSRIDAVDGISAYVDLSTNQLVINASPGHGFDFAGRIDQVPDLSSVTGTSEPRFSGEYTGSNNDQWSVTFSGAGTVGVTLGLTATVRDQAGQVLTILDIGQGYEPGKALEIKDGVSLQFASGTVDATDTFSVPVTAVSDEGGVLSALGLNSLFVGSGTGEYKVRDDIAQSPGLLAVSSTGFVGDSTNIAEMASLRDFRFAALEDRTFVETLADMTAIIGLDVQETENQLQHLETFGERLQAERESLSGVDPAEELLYMMQVERAFQAAARFLTTVNETLGEVLRIGS
jgi:flagellar hook-associated protein FlgK